MNSGPASINRRLLVIDDNPAIHEDFRKILCRDSQSTLALNEAEAELFGDVAAETTHNAFFIESAFQGEEGLELVRHAMTERRPYALVFLDVRMPPGWDGIDTAVRIWEVDPNVQIVLCTAYSDYSWKEILAKLGRSDRLMILKKPFDNIEVLQLADALTRKWQRAHDGNRHLAALQHMIRDRSAELGGRTTTNIDEGHLEMASEAANTSVRRQLLLEDELRHSLEAGHVSVQYQPLFNISTRRVTSLEALARWRHPAKGWISPAEFIPIAEASGLIHALGEHVLRTVCLSITRWERDGVPVVPIAVNISAVQLRRGRFLETVRGILRETGASPRYLVLELTESTLIENVQRYADAIQELREDGVGIEIDDFGTGYSGLSYLKQLPVDGIKIDRSFISQIDTNPVDASIVSAIVAMAHSLGLNVTAEGVETTGQLEVLAAQGCDVAQGFLLSRPIDAGACRELLTAAGRHGSATETPCSTAIGGA
jgi:EAL domain-containing protein (putative c-di-GMP-specific phosphodiesterase class I)/CheY-like chemotaxis protein